MRLLLDYRPALRSRTGVGEWIHQLARTLVGLKAAGDPLAAQLDLTLFTSSWSERPEADARRELPGATLVDRRIPVRLLTLAWNRLGWPAIETLAPGPFDIVQATTPIMVPSRCGRRAITVYDLDFLNHPERTSGEMRRDFPALARRHAAGADLVVTISEFSARSIERQLGVPASRITVCRPGVPDWAVAASRPDAGPVPGYVLFVGTLEPRKNVPGLLDAYQRLASDWPAAPTLVLAGGSTPAAEPWLARIAEGPLAARVDARGYVAHKDRRALYERAAVLVLPSFDEGFGLPVLEAMALGVPVVATTRGAIPEVAGNAALLVDPEDGDAIAHAIKRVLTEPGLARSLRAAGLARAREFSWTASARTLLEAYRLLLASSPAAIGAGPELS